MLCSMFALTSISASARLYRSFRAYSASWRAMLLVYPNAGKWVLSLLFPIWFIAHCLSRLSHLNTIRFIAGNFVYWFTMIVNIIGLVLGVVMIFSPNISVAAVAYIVGAYLVLFGIDCIILAFSRIGEGKQY